jgi:hypothetical protein
MIPATWEMEIGGLRFKVTLGNSATPYIEKNKLKQKGQRGDSSDRVQGPASKLKYCFKEKRQY